jgi:hypothetical protein
MRDPVKMCKLNRWIRLVTAPVSAFNSNRTTMKIRRKTFGIRFKEDDFCNASGNNVLTRCDLTRERLEQFVRELGKQLAEHQQRGSASQANAKDR